MKNSEKMANGLFPIGINEVEDKIVVIRGVQVIADADVASLYGIKTKDVSRAVGSNPEKFPSCYMFELSMSELGDLRRKISSAVTLIYPGGKQYEDEKAYCFFVYPARPDRRPGYQYAL